MFNDRIRNGNHRGQNGVDVVEPIGAMIRFNNRLHLVDFIKRANEHVERVRKGVADGGEVEGSFADIVGYAK